MSWAEFCTLLSGIMPKTPLGQIVSIRSEENEEMLKNFSKEQHEIRNEWRAKQSEKMALSTTDEEKEQMVKNVQEIFKNAFS